MQNTQQREYLRKNTPLFDSVGDVKTICQPLFNSFNINYFDYGRFYNDSTFIILSSDADWIEYGYNTGFTLGCTLKNEGMHLWQSLYPDTSFQHAKKYFNHDYGASIFVKHDDYIEFFDFAAPVTNNQILSSYFNKYDILKKFCRNFVEKSDSLINKFKEKPIIVPDAMHGDIIPDLGTDLFYDEKTNFSLTKRQIDCLILLVKGMSAKQVAKQLSLSPRTVEHYIENIKSKLCCSNRHELIIKALEIKIISDSL